MPATPPPAAPEQPTVDLDDTRQRKPGGLPHERDQQPSQQGPDAGQHQTPEAQSAFDDARRGRPDTSAAPQLQQPSPGEQQAKRQ